jgi:hypothetical protein
MVPFEKGLQGCVRNENATPDATPDELPVSNQVADGALRNA